MKLFSSVARWLGLAVFVLVTLGAPVLAKDLKLRVQLVWGTNEGKPPGKDMPELDNETREKILKPFRWKNYFVVKSSDAASSKEMRHLDLSDHCAVELREVGGQVEVRVLSLKAGAEPKVATARNVNIEKLRKGGVFVFAGDSKDNVDDAWLVVIRSAP